MFADGIVNWRPPWMPDGKSVTFVSVGELGKDPYGITIYRALADGSARAQRLQKYRFGLWEREMSRYGQWLVVRTATWDVRLAKPFAFGNGQSVEAIV